MLDLAMGPKLMVCHDLKGNYRDDRFPQGVRSPVEVPYTVEAWECIDTLVYFGHDLVTLPPPGWTDAAHRHGVRVLGTIITEGPSGPRDCARLFGAEAAKAADRLAAVAAYYGFDGYVETRRSLPCTVCCTVCCSVGCTV